MHPTPRFIHCCSVITAKLIKIPPVCQACHALHHKVQSRYRTKGKTHNWCGSQWNEIRRSRKPMRYLFTSRYDPRGLPSGNQCRSRIAAAEMSLSAAVSARCAVWKSSVMAYLMVIVRGGERPPCLHAGICGVQSGGLRRCSSSSSGEETGGRREMVRFHSAFFPDFLRL